MSVFIYVHKVKDCRTTLKARSTNGTSKPDVSTASQHLPITHARQISLCGCGLAALEMVVRYYGADVSQLLGSDKRLQKKVDLGDPRSWVK
jgi:hypothetical protein